MLKFGVNAVGIANKMRAANFTENEISAFMRANNQPGFEAPTVISPPPPFNNSGGPPNFNTPPVPPTPNFNQPPATPPNFNQPPPTPSGGVNVNDPKYSMFKKMLKMKIPAASVRNKMIQSQLQESEIDAFLSAARGKYVSSGPPSSFNSPPSGPEVVAADKVTNSFKFLSFEIKLFLNTIEFMLCT